MLYKDEESLKNFFNPKFLMEYREIKSSFEWSFSNEYFKILCIRGLKENLRGHKVDYIAVQEEFTWSENWEKFKTVLKPTLAFQVLPAPIYIFDGISREE